MPLPAWQLDGFSAVAQLGPFHATIDLTRPATGIRWNINGQSARLSLGSSLAVQWPEVTNVQSDGVSTGSAALDAYVRNDDLVATYHLRDRPLRGQLYFRRCPLENQLANYFAVELITSMQTHLLDSDPTVRVCSSFSAESAIALKFDSANHVAESQIAIDRETVLTSSDAVGCFVLRLSDPGWSVVELVHPADFTHAEFQPTGDKANQLDRIRVDHKQGVPRNMRATYRLFAGRLEKGVILRARIRTAFIPRADDVRVAAELYRDFAASPPPLTT